MGLPADGGPVLPEAGPNGVRTASETGHFGAGTPGLGAPEQCSGVKVPSDGGSSMRLPTPPQGLWNLVGSPSRFSTRDDRGHAKEHPWFANYPTTLAAGG
jgi:hypothetical protein